MARAETDPQYDPLMGEISDYQRRRRRQGARGAQELIRRTAGGAAGLSPEQIEAGALPGFERPLSRRERLSLQRDITAIMASLDKVDAIRQKEKSVSNREMARALVELAGQWGDILQSEVAANAQIGAAELEARSLTINQRMETLNRQMALSGWDFNQERFDTQRGLSAGIKADLGGFFSLSGETHVEQHVNRVTGESTQRSMPGYRIAEHMTAGQPNPDHIGLSTAIFDNLSTKTDEEGAYWLDQVEALYPGILFDEILAVDGVSGALQNEQRFDQVQRMYVAARRVQAQRQLLDDEALTRQLGMIDEMTNIGRSARVNEATLSNYMGMQDLAINSASSPQFRYGNSWDPPPPPEAGIEAHNEWLELEWDATVDETGNVFVANENDELIPLIGADGQTQQTYEGLYADEMQGRQEMVVGPGLTETEITRGTTEAEPPGQFATEARDYLDTMWKELQQGKKPALFQEMSNLFDPSTEEGVDESGIQARQWAEERGYSIESDGDRDWATRQLIRETRFNRRKARKDRRLQLRENIASGESPANPVRRARAQIGEWAAGLRDGEEEAADIGRDVGEPGPSGTITAGAEEGGAPTATAVEESAAAEEGAEAPLSREDILLEREAQVPLPGEEPGGGLSPELEGIDAEEPPPPSTDVGFVTPVPAEPIWEDVSDEDYTLEQQSANDRLLQHALNAGLINQDDAVQWRIEMKESDTPPEEFAEALLALSQRHQIAFNPEVEQEIRAAVPGGGGPSWGGESIEERQPITGGVLGIEPEAPLSAADQRALQMERESEEVQRDLDGTIATAHEYPTSYSLQGGETEPYTGERPAVVQEQMDREARLAAQEEETITGRGELAETFPDATVTETGYGKPEESGLQIGGRPESAATGRSREEAAGRFIEQYERRPGEFSELGELQGRLEERRSQAAEEARAAQVQAELDAEEEREREERERREREEQRRRRERGASDRLMNVLDVDVPSGVL